MFLRKISCLNVWFVFISFFVATKSQNDISCLSPGYPFNCKEDAFYSTFDGSCNNLNNPWWTKTHTPYNRFIPSAYSDGIDGLRFSVTGQELPSARKISTELFPDGKNNDDLWTHMTMSFGQFLTHDVTSAMSQGRVDCCNDIDDPHICSPIPIPPDDFLYVNQTCLNFVRRANTRSIGCTQDDVPAQQINEVTPVIDLSVIYGLSENEADSLRQKVGGKLKISTINGKEYMPYVNSAGFCSEICFIAGDFRVNQNLPLTLVHVVFFRMHNKIAENLEKHNPNWSDEKLFNESRRILISIMQHITYSEYLPILLGQSLIDLSPLTSGYTVYDPNLDPRILNVFTASSNRGQHSIIQGKLKLADSIIDCLNETYVNLSENFFKPKFLTENFDSTLIGLISQPMEPMDRFITTAVSNEFLKEFRPPGIDLAALDVKRDEDHGLPSYTEVRKKIFDDEILSFDDIIKNVGEQNAKRLSKIYKDVRDVHLIVGSLMESPINSATMLGETSHYIIGEQYRRLKYGDRFYYEHGGLSSSFNSDQLNRIKKFTLSHLLCLGGNDINYVTKKAFNLPNLIFNPVINCNILKFDFDFPEWKEHENNAPNCIVNILDICI